MTFGKRVSTIERAERKRARNEIPARSWVPVLGAVVIGIGFMVAPRLVANIPPVSAALTSEEAADINLLYANPCGASALLAVSKHYDIGSSSGVEVSRDENDNFECRIIHMDTKTADVVVQVEQGVLRWTVNISMKWHDGRPNAGWNTTSFDDHGKRIAVSR